MNKNKNLSIKEIFALAVKNHQKNRLDNAQNLYNQILKINPNYINAHNNLGAIFNNFGEYQKAKECYEKAIIINPNYADAHNNLGVVFKVLGEYQKAKECYEKAILINPNYADALNNLGSIFNNFGKYQKAKECYEKAIEINPEHVNAQTNLGAVFSALGDHKKAILCYRKTIQIDPNNVTSINNLSLLLQSIKIDNKLEADESNLKKLFLFLFKKNNIDPTQLSKKAKLSLFSDDDCNHLLKVIKSETSLLTNDFIQNLLKEELFHLMLQKSLITDKFLEKLLTKLRSEILFTLEAANKDILKEYLFFIISLAEQCWFNEHIYVQSAKEITRINKLIDKIKNDKEVNELEIAVLGCYMPFNSSKIIINKLLNYKSKNILFNDLTNVQIKEPLREIELIKSIESLDEIVDPVSKKVQVQYEENPYPRWRCINDNFQFNFLIVLNQDVNPNKVECANNFESPNVLIAGCGTGSHPISSNAYKNANIIGVDLSLTSLAYAKRKTEELGYKNIKYLHADILQLKKLNRKFDIIESAGTLHHMNDPVTGLKVLIDMLEPHGFLKLGLYSETARRDVVKAREFIKNKDYKNTSNDIKICRQNIINNKEEPLFQKLTFRHDFYSTSTARDLLFNVQEHRFTIPEIAKILKNLNLEFLGFNFVNPLIKKAFSKSFPYDKKNISLDNWHQFEIDNPDTFYNMYQFWVRKI